MRCSNLEIREEGTVEILKHITVEWQGNLKTIFCKCFADIPPMGNREGIGSERQQSKKHESNNITNTNKKTNHSVVARHCRNVRKRTGRHSDSSASDEFFCMQNGRQKFNLYTQLEGMQVCCRNCCVVYICICYMQMIGMFFFLSVGMWLKTLCVRKSRGSAVPSTST